MKKLFLSMMALGFGFAAFSQGYYQIPGPTGSNPGGLNTDAEYPPGGGLPSGWTTIMTGNGADQWSGAYSVPFTFQFNGSAETQFKVSNTGVLTFTTGAATIPTETNADLPDATIPDKSVLCWGLNVKGTGDYIVTKTFGTAPNRQFWISFNSASEKNIQSGWLYMSIVLEETSNAIYLVDQRFFCTDGTNPCSNKTALSLGIQINSTTAVKVAGTPSYAAVSGNNVVDPTDNKYFGFFPGTQLVRDLKMLSTSVSDIVIKSANTAVSGTLTNYGSATVNSFDLYYSVNGGAAVKSSIGSVSIATGDVYTYTSLTPYVAPAGGIPGKILIWTANINGGADQKVSNDSVSKSFFVVNGTGAPKKVFVEEATGAWCQHCPDAHTYLQKLHDDFGSDVVLAVHHNSDAMTNPESNLINTAFASGYPNGYIDRGFYSGYTKVGTNRGDWNNLVTTQKTKYTPVKVNMKNVSFDPTSRLIKFDVEAEFTDYYAGDIRIGAMIKEEYMRGPAGGAPDYDQVISSIYTTNPAHVYYNYTSPMGGYYHKHVIINIPSGAWGSAGSIPATAAPGDKFSKTYTYTLPALTNVAIAANAQFSPKGVTVFGRNKPQEIWLIGFVAKNNTDVTMRDVLNVNERQMWDLAAGTVKLAKGTTALNAYPNPANNSSAIEFELLKSQKVTVKITNALGQLMSEQILDEVTAGSHTIKLDTDKFANGMYNVTIIGEEVNGSCKLMVAH
jgi:hypothetical protein